MPCDDDDDDDDDDWPALGGSATKKIIEFINYLTLILRVSVDSL